ncbi:Asp-tRNA(Asn)/Glu-tRNA(Gln) amidotransferase GatCAB subunit A [Candidatus Peregrinibacteria bacterium CG_4_9_14_0_2_um_filter_53_11]|nr:MAG: Asp-tRNA(Asn)/Glu-tRNA(Gln) amidotransferase GatCAB subunit A [Candidatus Peregrinibacteria bacterium CG_4_9_14_0_2_um_filter_53_11]
MDLARLTIHEAAEGLRSKTFSSVELTKSVLDQIAKRDGAVRAYVHVDEEGALASAARADERFEKGSPLSQLDGIPCGLKDVFCTKGLPTTACSNILRDFVPPYDATVVGKLKDAGMVLVGKTNTDEFTCGSSTESSCFGPSHNPWDLERTPGGSSGGSAAAVAADECIYALGTDTGGSIRQPAAYCGITGLKVTYGRVSRFGVISMASSLDSIGPLTKDARDAAIVLKAIAGHDPHDTTTPQLDIPDYLNSLGQPCLNGLKIGLPKEYFSEALNPEVAQLVRDAAAVLEKEGAILKEVSLPLTPSALAVYYIICPSEVSANMARYDGIRYGPGPEAVAKGAELELEEYYRQARGEGFGPEMKRRIMMGTYALSSGYYDAYYKKAQQVRTLIIQDFQRAFEEVDILLAPTTPTPAFKLGEHTSDPVQMYLEDVFTVAINCAGLPSLALPCGFSSEKNLPVGFQLIGPQFGESRLLQAGAYYQTLTQWHQMRSQIAMPS